MDLFEEAKPEERSDAVTTQSCKNVSMNTNLVSREEEFTHYYWF